MTITPGNHNAITTQLGDQGLGQQPWWVEQWMELINGYRFKKRLERAWEYARSGNVLSIRFEGRRVHARVQGSGEDPYKVKLWLDVLSDDDWRYVLEALGQKARWSAQLLAGVMPQDIERAFAASGRRLFPFKLQEVRSECTCPDKINPCKHVSAVYYLMGERSHNQAPAAIRDPNRWWRYDAALDPALVVITPAMEGDTGLDEAGPLPLAEDGRFPEAARQFVEQLRAQGAGFSSRALATAMAAGNRDGANGSAHGPGDGHD